MVKKRIQQCVSVIQVLMLLFMLAACGGDSPSESTASQSASVSETISVSAESPAVEKTEAKTRIFTDLAGAEVELPVQVEKVLHLWPASTAMQVFLGSEDKIVGTLQVVQKGWGWLTAAAPNLLEVPGFTGDATAEELLALNPDVVITPKKEAAEAYRQAGVPAVCMLAGEDMDSLKEMITKMGELLGEKEAAKAAEYNAYLDQVIQTVGDAVADIPESERAVIYYNSAQHGESPLLTCGDGSIVETWMLAAGCVNAVTGVVSGMDKEVSMEAIAAANPDYVLVGGSYQDAALAAIHSEPAWQALPAVAEGRIIRNPQGVMKWEKFGVEIVLQMQWFVQQVYPDALDVDIKSVVTDFYANYYGLDLTDAQYEDLMAGLSAPAS